MAVARLLNFIEAEGRWPTEWLDAYVAMIPKAAGGSRPQDQRPITVLEVLYRLWAKGVVLQWGPVLQRLHGGAGLGFARPGTTTRGTGAPGIHPLAATAAGAAMAGLLRCSQVL